VTASAKSSAAAAAGAIAAAPADSPRRTPPLLLNSTVLAMVFIWSLNYVFGKYALLHMDGLTLAAFRLVMAGVLIVPVYLVVYFAGTRRQGFPMRDWPALVWLALFGVVLNQGCFTLGLSLTSAGHSAIIVGTAPVVVLLLARWRGLETLGLGRVIGMAIAFTGIIILTSEHVAHFGPPGLRAHPLLGDLFTLLGVIGFSVYTVWGKELAARYDSIAMNAFNQAAAAVIVLPLAIRQAMHMDIRAIGWRGWADVFYMAAMSSIVGYVIFYWALRRMPASRLAAFSYLQPLVVILLGAVLLGERLTPHVALGGSLALAGVYLTEHSK
jgi:drug/metabolite transporter (DMT)-like permease